MFILTFFVFLFLPQMDKLIADVDPRPEVMPR